MFLNRQTLLVTKDQEIVVEKKCKQYPEGILHLLKGQVVTFDKYLEHRQSIYFVIDELPLILIPIILLDVLRPIEEITTKEILNYPNDNDERNYYASRISGYFSKEG